MKSANAEHSPASPESASMSYNFKRANYRRLNARLSRIDWEVILDHHDVNDNVATSYATLRDVFDQFVPELRFVRTATDL